MNQFLGMYSGLLVPGVIALVLLFVVVKVVNAIVRIVSLVLFVAVLTAGFLAYGRLSAIQNAVNAAANQSRTGRTTATALYDAVGVPARQALSAAGLDPSLLRVRILCAGTNTQIQLRYQGPGFMFGVLNQYYDVPHNSRVRC